MKFTLEQVKEIYNLPFTTLIHRAQEMHQKYQDPAGVQLSTLQSIKTGACSEDCAYCPQSARYDTFVGADRLMKTDAIVDAAKKAKEGGASRFCMGASWRDVPNTKQFDSVLESVSAVNELGLEVCCTLGMLTEDQADQLSNAGCAVYNHNLDSSREFYKKIITTRSYDERLDTLKNVRKAGMEICCGGILGMGETEEDRLELLVTLANLEPQPESVPINALVAVDGTPMEGREFVDSFEFVRAIAVARIIMPKAIVRLSAGRTQMSDEMQTLCFVAGANSIFLGDKLLTTENPETNEDLQLLSRLGLHPLDPKKAREFHAAGDNESSEVTPACV